MSNPIFFNEKQTAQDYFRNEITTKALQKWRLTGSGPAFIKLGSRVLYRKEDLDTWVEARRRQSTSEKNRAK